LADVCEFEIALSTKPKGLPSKPVSLDTLALSVNQSGRYVVIDWRTPLAYADSIAAFEVLKQGASEFKRKVVARMPLRLNALGKADAQYSFRDTLSKHDTYTYSIVGIYQQEKQRVLLQQQEIAFWPAKSYGASTPKQINFSIEARKKTDFDFFIMNALTGEVLFKQRCLQCTTQTVEFDVTEDVAKGILKYRVECYNARTKQWSHMEYTVNK
jgi:hypothetical protein